MGASATATATTGKSKRVVYFIDPLIVRDVKALATANDCDQSDVVEKALRTLIAASPHPRLLSKSR